MLQENMKAWRDRKQQEWTQDGELRGELRGELKGAAKMLSHLLQRRFGTVPVWASEKIMQANKSSLEEWGLRVLDAQSLDEVLSDRK